MESLLSARHLVFVGYFLCWFAVRCELRLLGVSVSFGQSILRIYRTYRSVKYAPARLQFCMASMIVLFALMLMLMPFSIYALIKDFQS